MTIAFDASSEATAGTSDPMEWQHTPVGTPKGVFVGIVRNAGSAQDIVSGVTYGGQAMTRVPNSTADDKADDTANETGSSWIYFLGTSIPTGEQTVSVDFTEATSTRWAACVTVTADEAETELVGDEYTPIEANTANPSITITGIPGTSYGAGVLFSGLGTEASATAGSGMTMRQSHDFGNQVCFMESSTSEQASGDLTIAFTAATDDVAMVVAAIAEIEGTPTLAINDGLHAHAADNIALTQHNVLAINDASHGHTADNVVLVPNLIVADALHAHTADNLSLTQHHVLAVQDATHGHTAENQALTQHNVLAIQDATHGHAADNLALTQHNVLVIADAAHAHAADNLALTPHEPGGPVSLEIQDAGHAHTADSLVLGVGLVIADATHGHSADNLELTQHNVLAIADALHAHTAEVPQLSLPGEEPTQQDFVRLRRRRGMGTR